MPNRVSNGTGCGRGLDGWTERPDTSIATRDDWQVSSARTERFVLHFWNIVLLTLCAESTRMAAWSLDDTHLDLFPTHEDLVTLLHALRARSADGSMDEETWHQLVLLGRTPDGIGDAVREAAIETANGNAALLAILDEVSRDRWTRTEGAASATRESRRGPYTGILPRSTRPLLANQPHAVAAGDVQFLTVPAEVYLGRPHEMFDSSMSPEVRLCELLGAPLVDQALAGFVAVLQRNDLPSAAAIADIHCRDGRYCAEEPMICGIAESASPRPAARCNRSHDARGGLSWRGKRAPESGTEGPLDMEVPRSKWHCFGTNWTWRSTFARVSSHSLPRGRTTSMSSTD